MQRFEFDKTSLHPDALHALWRQLNRKEFRLPGIGYRVRQLRTMEVRSQMFCSRLRPSQAWAAGDTRDNQPRHREVLRRLVR